MIFIFQKDDPLRCRLPRHRFVRRMLFLRFFPLRALYGKILGIHFIPICVCKPFHMQGVFPAAFRDHSPERHAQYPHPLHHGHGLTDIVFYRFVVQSDISFHLRIHGLCPHQDQAAGQLPIQHKIQSVHIMEIIGQRPCPKEQRLVLLSGWKLRKKFILIHFFLLSFYDAFVVEPAQPISASFFRTLVHVLCCSSGFLCALLHSSSSI